MKKTFNEINYNGINDRSHSCNINMSAHMSSQVFGLGYINQLAIG